MSGHEATSERLRLDWLDPLKALALLGILLNHTVEEFGPGPWFTNPSNDWPDFQTRMSGLFPQGHSLPVSLIQFTGWLGDSGPGVFIFLSGLGLTWAALSARDERINVRGFYKRRVARIFPLYVAMHFVMLAAALLVPPSRLTMASTATLLSMLGLRVTPELFFYIAPAWWFVWLVLQLYLVFPFLYNFLRRKGVALFLFVTCAFTFVSRLLGLLFSDHLYYWMTGIFFGTRLAEFAAGMAAAVLLSRKSGDAFSKISDEPFGAGQALAWALPVYVVGLVASFTWAGSIVSNLLVTLGLTGIFYAAWQGVLKKNRRLASALVWMGATSYAVYLFHQPPLDWTGVFVGTRPRLHFIAALAVLILSFPAALLIARCVERLERLAPALKGTRSARLLSLVVSAGVVLALLFIEPRLWSEWKGRAFALALGLSLCVLLFSEWAAQDDETRTERILRWTATGAALIQLFIFPQQFGPVALAASFVMAAFASLFYAFWKSRPLAWASGLVCLLLLMTAAEMALRRFAPVEAGAWGELPALELNRTRRYSLKPNLSTRLRYNNYDYVLRTNSLGLPGPERNTARPTPDTLRILVIGDAFAMPEGLAYESSFAFQLEQQLSRCSAPRPVEVINAGVTGYGPAEEYAQLRELAPRFKPDIIVYEFFINEFEEASLTTDERLRAIGLTQSQQPFFRRLMENSQTFARLNQIRDAIAERLSGRAAPWRSGKALLNYYRTGDNPLYNEESTARVRSFLEGMSRTARDEGARFIIYFVPGAAAVSEPSQMSYFPWDENLADATRYDMELPSRNLRAIADPLGIEVFDLTPGLKLSTEQPVYFPDSWHWNEAGHKAAAREIARSLVERNLVSKECGQEEKK